jgi:YD repeat-containing protein
VRAIAAVLSLLVLLAAAGVLIFVNARLTNTEAYKNSLAIAESSPAVQSALGINIQASRPVIGYSLPFPGSEFAQWSVPLRGSQGEGHLYGVANETNGSWEFARLVFVSDGGDKKLDLNTVDRTQGLPPIPPQKVYLAPIGFSENESLDWASKYYKAKLGIETIVLPPIALDPALENPQRLQLDAIKGIEFLQTKYPELARDPYAVLIGVTSQDIYVSYFDWTYTVNWRSDGRYAIVSAARLHPPSLLERWNPEWFNARLQKLLTKNIAILYFGLPLSSDYTSLVSGGIPSGIEIDAMGGRIIGGQGAWKSFIGSGDPGVTLYDAPGKPLLWRLDYLNQPVRDTQTQIFNTDISLGLFVQRKTDFILAEEYPLRFTRVYTINDSRSRSFGVGASDTLDMFLIGQIGSYVELCLEDGARIRFNDEKSKPGHPDVYRQAGWDAGPFKNALAEFDGSEWSIKANDGWTYYFPYHANWLPQYVTALGSFTDPGGHEYKMERDEVGDLLSVTTPSGKWLRFDNDAQHRIQRIQSSTGRTVRYEYDRGGRLIHAVDSDGHEDAYTYDDRAQMITARHEKGAAVITNSYSNDGYITGQRLEDGRKLQFSYFRTSQNILRESHITDPDGMLTSYMFWNGYYTQTLPRLGGQE